MNPVFFTFLIIIESEGHYRAVIRGLKITENYNIRRIDKTRIVK